MPRPHGSRRKARPRSQTVGRMQNKTRGPGRRFSPHLIFFSLADGGAKSDVASQTVLQRMPDANSCLPKGVPWSDALEKLNKKIPLPRACSQPSMRAVHLETASMPCSFGVSWDHCSLERPLRKETPSIRLFDSDGDDSGHRSNLRIGSGALTNVRGKRASASGRRGHGSRPSLCDGLRLLPAAPLAASTCRALSDRDTRPVPCCPSSRLPTTSKVERRVCLCLGDILPLVPHRR